MSSIGSNRTSPLSSPASSPTGSIENITSQTPALGRSLSSPVGSPNRIGNRTLNPLLSEPRQPGIVTPIDPKRITVLDQSLVATIKTAKTMEWKATCDAMKESFMLLFQNKGIDQNPVAISKFFHAQYNTIQITAKIEERITRFIQKQCQLSAIPVPPTLKNDVTLIVADIKNKMTDDVVAYDLLMESIIQYCTENKINHKSTPFTLQVVELANLFHLLELTEECFKEDYALFVAHLESISDLMTYSVENEPSLYQPIALSILYKIRDALNNDFYLLCKNDETFFPTEFLHTLCLACYANTKVIPAFSALGSALHSMNPPEDLPIQLLLHKKYREAVEHGATTDDPVDKDSLWTRLRESISLVTSSIRAQVPVGLSFNALMLNLSSYFSKAKDHRGIYNNNPGALYDETIKIGSKSLHTRTVVAASPAFDTVVVPEFTALLQAMENRHFFQITPEFKDAFPYFQISYTNLQSKAGQIEGAQTRAIMQLNELYPLSFKAITVSQESFAATIPDNHLDEEVKERFLKALTADSSFTLSKEPGFYFSPSDKDEWKTVLKNIVDKSYTAVHKENASVEEKKEQIVAFCELVKLGIIRYHEIASMQRLHETIPNDAKFLFMRLCATCADRGGKINTSFLWAFGNSEDPNWNRFVTSVCLGRALLAKGRLPLPSRLEEMGILANQVTQAKIKEYLRHIDVIASPNKSVRSTGFTVLQ